MTTTIPGIEVVSVVVSVLGVDATTGEEVAHSVTVVTTVTVVSTVSMEMIRGFIHQMCSASAYLELGVGS